MPNSEPAPINSGFGFSNYRQGIADSSVLSQQFLPEHQQRVAHTYQPDVIVNTIHHKRDSRRLYREHYPDFPHPGTTFQTVTDYADLIKTDQAYNPLMQKFFSKENIDHLQQEIIRQIYQQSQGRFRISRQSDDELFIVMRSVYLSAPTDPCNRATIPQQIAQLNFLVLNDVIPRIIENIHSYLGFVRDNGQAVRPIDRPIATNTAGIKLCRGPSSLIP